MLLKDRHHSVMLTGVTLILELCSMEPNLIPVFREEVPLLVKILRNLLISPFLPEYDCNGITNPFLQVKVCDPQICMQQNRQQKIFSARDL